MTTGGARANFGAPGVSNRSFCNAKTAISPPPPFLSRAPRFHRNIAAAPPESRPKARIRNGAVYASQS